MEESLTLCRLEAVSNKSGMVPIYSLKYKAFTKADCKGKAVIVAIPQSQTNYKTDCNVCLPFHGSVAFSGACAVCSL